MLLSAVSPVAAQDVSLWLDASTSYARPPAGVTADPSQFALVGGRLGTQFDWGSMNLSGRYGEAFWGSQGRWLQGEAVATTGGRIGTLGVRALVSGFGLQYLDPFRYDAGGIEVQPSISLPTGAFIISALPRLSTGGWSADRASGTLRVVGGDVELLHPFGPISAVVSGGALSVGNGVTAGTFVRGAGGLIVDRGQWTAQFRLETQQTPLETELGGGIRFSLRLARGVELHAYGGRTLRDPLFGTPGSLGFSVTATVRAIHWSPTPPPAVAAIGDREAGGRVVRFAIHAPDAESVEITGDFTGWESVAMERGQEGWWHLRRVLGPGLHHFGFLVDGHWAIPEDAPGVVDDGWGRRNASIVVDP